MKNLHACRGHHTPTSKLPTHRAAHQRTPPSIQELLLLHPHIFRVIWEITELPELLRDMPADIVAERQAQLAQVHHLHAWQCYMMEAEKVEHHPVVAVAVERGPDEAGLVAAEEQDLP